MTAELKLAEIISARLCHDLAGPIGTLSSSLEMIAEGGPDAAEALAIAHDAARAMQSRLRFVRAAWAVDGAALDGSTIAAYCAALPAARKISFDIKEMIGGFSAAMSRGLLNLALLGIESLPRGGTIAFAGSREAGVAMTIEGRYAAWPAGFAALLADESTAWTALTDSRSLQAPLTALILCKSGLKLRFLMAGGDTAAPPPVFLTEG